jgi:hypothetical protein
VPHRVGVQQRLGQPGEHGQVVVQPHLHAGHRRTEPRRRPNAILVAMSGSDEACDQAARAHRPVGLNIGSRTPAEIAIATLAGLLADRNARPGGFHFGLPG